ncbi:methyltransferase domain-containing protein [Pseudarthrobacter phenanthrenivorans]|uniref:Methyltransferase domain-containing protein n=1 Tax=Pseudarthrobacter phenanthrenivorans TaxID=361575 RepID=A0A3B0G0X1_PSEPS|nr:class I SAM-dependent methyltransferase [Pseudarthrobacter phenanthrenivorans]RKO27442.1 methyltransferase domain-containing protein [Pseudarthrobacter phenanthrenivorans]
MIVPNISQSTAAVADHYDELDPVYRRVWGDHVHHGLWVTGRETPGEAVEALVDTVGERLRLTPGETCVDIGCGYGSTARRLAATRGVRVTGFTLSAEQAHFAAAHSVPDVDIRVRDWLDNDVPDASVDAAWAIESSEHMVDKPGFFAEAHRVLLPGGSFVICAWLAESGAGGWKVRHLLEPVCREGRLPSMGTREEYEAMATAAGFVVTGYEDVSRRVARTWMICAGRLVKALFTDGEMRRLALRARNRVFVLSIPRLILAYRTGAMHYGIFTLTKAGGSGRVSNQDRAEKSGELHSG